MISRSIVTKQRMLRFRSICTTVWQIGVAAALQKKEAAQKGSKLNLELTRICRAHRHNGPSILSSMLAFFLVLLFFFPLASKELWSSLLLNELLRETYKYT